MSALPRKHCSTQAGWAAEEAGRGCSPQHFALCSAPSPLPAGAASRGLLSGTGSVPLSSQLLALSGLLSEQGRSCSPYSAPSPPHLALPSPPGHVSGPSQPRPVSVSRRAPSSARLFCLTTRKCRNTAGRERENTPSTSKRCDSGGREGLLPQETVFHTGGDEELMAICLLHLLC